MAFFRTLFILVLVSMAITPLFVGGSRLYPQVLSKMAAHTSTQDDVDTKYGVMFGKGTAAVRAKIGGTEDSEREVPTGPDPLHHHHIDLTSASP